MGDTSLAGKFGLHPLDARTAVEVGQKLESRLEAFLELESPLAEVFEGYRRQNILENDDVVYMPVGWIGCCGLLIVKASDTIIQFGSYMGPESHIWAFYRGANIAGKTGPERKNDIIVTAVADEQQTLRVFRSILTGRHVNNELKPKLRSALPVRVADVDLYFALRDLHEAEESRWFDFTIEPASS